MGENLRPQFDEIDGLINEVEQSASGKLLAEIDDLCSEINNGLGGRKQEIMDWPIERKRKEAADSTDPFVLNLMSMDQDFNVRALSACNPNTPTESLRRLVEEANDYVKMVIANNPNCSANILDRISELSGEPEVLEAVKGSPNISAVTKYKIENRM